ncbi:MAG: hypothetical protein AMXMBFR83_10570 [Phycisphaerae bacterium]
MPIDVSKLRKLLAMDENDALSRYALGRKLFEEGASEAEWREAAEHLRFAQRLNPEHLATYHVLAQVLLRLGLIDEARDVLRAGVAKTAAAGECMGRDLGPVMEEMLADLPGRGST